MTPTSGRFKQINKYIYIHTHTHTHTHNQRVAWVAEKQMSYMEDKFRRIYHQEGKLDYTSPLNFMLKVHKNSVPTANKIYFVYIVTSTG